jgi:predicted amidohydrolase
MFNTRIRVSAFAAASLLSAQRISGQIEALDLPPGRPGVYLPDAGAKIACANLCVKKLRSLRDYISHINQYVSAAAQAGCLLITFPEVTGMLSLTLLPGFSSLQDEFLPLAKRSDDLPDAFWDACEATQQLAGRVFFTVFSQLARTHRILIAAAGLYRIQSGSLYSRQYLFSETGELLGDQGKLFPSAFERAAGVSAQGTLHPVDTPIGRIALLCADDLPNYEPFAVARALGCNLALVAGSTHSPDLALARYRAQEQNLFLAVSGLNAQPDIKISLNTPCGVFAPRGATRLHDGVIAQGGDDVLCGRVDFGRIGAQFDSYCADKNPEFFRALLT